MVEALGKIHGEEVIRVSGTIRTSAQATIRGAQKTVTCPEQRTEPGQRPRKKYKVADADPANIRLSLLTVNGIVFARISGEVLTRIGQRLKRKSPFTDTILITHANGEADISRMMAYMIRSVTRSRGRGSRGAAPRMRLSTVFSI
jgi:hypothetical protein